jgi:hypothetical protein
LRSGTGSKLRPVQPIDQEQNTYSNSGPGAAADFRGALGQDLLAHIHDALAI